MADLTDRLNLRYRSRLAELKATVRQRVTALYGETVKSDDLDASFAEFIPQAAGLVQAGQANGVALASAYLQTLIAFESGRQANLAALSDTGVVGITAEGVALAEGMDVFPAMVKERIGAGRPLTEALDFGRFATERFSDAEVTGAVDRHTDAVTQQSGEFAGWEGVVSANSCDRCKANAGLHSLNAPIYRHGACNCTKRFVVA